VTDIIRHRASRTLAGQAVVEIQDRILSGEFPPGARLPIEQLAELLDLSPMPIREALHRLDSLGFVEHIPHRGARVRALSLTDLLDTYAARLPLEMLATFKAAMVFTPDDEGLARALLDEYRRRDAEGDSRGARQAHADFHFTIYRASGSLWLVRLIQPIFDNSHRYRAASLPARDLDLRHREHLDILEACVAHDAPQAAAAMRDHLHTTVRTVAAQLDFNLEVELELAPIELSTYFVPVSDPTAAASAARDSA
jgi:DNA-binding GntR family transcriptional regulator